MHLKFCYFCASYCCSATLRIYENFLSHSFYGSGWSWLSSFAGLEILEGLKDSSTASEESLRNRCLNWLSLRSALGAFVSNSSGGI